MALAREEGSAQGQEPRVSQWPSPLGPAQDAELGQPPEVSSLLSERGCFSTFRDRELGAQRGHGEYAVEAKLSPACLIPEPGFQRILSSLCLRPSPAFRSPHSSLDRISLDFAPGPCKGQRAGGNLGPPGLVMDIPAP